MAIKLIANYSKRLGLPGYSSHQFSISIETELMNSDDIPGASERLYHLLQSNVDEQMLSTGFVPPKEYGLDVQEPNNIIHHQPSDYSNEVPPNPGGRWLNGPAWKCSVRQQDLILKLVDEHHLKKAEVEELALARFGKGVTLLSKVDASGLIDELLKSPKCAPPQDNGKPSSGSGTDRINQRKSAA